MSLCTCVQAQTQVFAAEFAQSNNEFGTIDLYTGDFTEIGSLGGALINDIAYSNSGTVYGIDGSSLVTFNTLTAGITTVGNFGVSGIETLAFDSNGTLYAATQSALYTVDPTTGNAVFVGNFGTPTGLNNNGQNIRFGDDGDLYDTNTSTNGTSTGIYRISLSTGGATYLGDAEGYINLVLANAGDQLYGVSVNVTNSSTTDQTLVVYDPTTFGDGSSPHDLDGTTLSGQANIPPNFNFSGSQDAAVPIPAVGVPEPSSYAALLLGFALFAALVRRRFFRQPVRAEVKRDHPRPSSSGK